MVFSTALGDWEIEHKLIKFKGKLGNRYLSEVWEGTWNGTIPVTIKTLKPGLMTVNDFLTEAQIMKLKHEKLIKLYGVCSRKEPICIVTELMKHGSLLDYLTKGDLKLSEWIHIGVQVADGMAYLESQHYIHRDLAARNIQIGEGNIVKIGGFSLARLLVDDCYLGKGEKIPIKWTAPEGIMFEKFTIKSDVWSFGVFLTELVTEGHVPYPGMTKVEVKELVNKGYRMPAPFGCPGPLYQIMLGCWKTDPEERPTFESLKHELENYFVSTEEDNVVGKLAYGCVSSWI